MYLQNKYTKYYYNIVNSATSRDLSKEVYTEKHHIIPKSLGGSNGKDNLVRLTAREHFICHWLLTKMTTGDLKAKMIYALSGMCRENNNQQRYKTSITAIVYENLRKESARLKSLLMTGRPRPDLKGRPSKRKGKTYGMKGKTYAEIGRSPSSLKGKPSPLRGKSLGPKGPLSAQHRLNVSMALTGLKQSIVVCPYCTKSGGLNAMKRHHFDNCKLK